MRKETASQIITVRFTNFYERVVTETYNKKKNYTSYKYEQLLNRATSSIGLKHQLELLGYVEVKEERAKRKREEIIQNEFVL